MYSCDFMSVWDVIISFPLWAEVFLLPSLLVSCFQLFDNFCRKLVNFFSNSED